MLPRLRFFALAPAFVAPLVLAGCHVSTHDHGKGDNVSIDTPFASMHVKTDKDAQPINLGLTVYPGAQPVTEDDGKNKDAADINMSFGDFHLGVKAASYQTHDPMDKVEAFYRKDMARYGDVLKCQGKQPVGQPTRTADGLTCNDNDKHGSANIHEDNGENPELRAGSPQHQHIVGLERKDGGTRIGLVALDLPRGLGHHDGSESE